MNKKKERKMVFMKKKAILAAALSVCLLLSGCGSREESAGNTGKENQSIENTGYSQTIPMEELKEAVVSILGENYWPDTQISDTMLEEVYGVKKDLYEDFYGEMPMISVNVDTLLIVKAKDGQQDDVKTALNDYREKLINDSMQYPQNLGKIQASRIETFGNYVCFVQLGADTTSASDIGEDAVIEQCTEENERALDAIEKALMKQA